MTLLLTGPKRIRCYRCDGGGCRVCGFTGLYTPPFLIRNTGRDYLPPKPFRKRPLFLLATKDGKAIEHLPEGRYR